MPVQHDEGFFTAKDNLRLFWQSDVPANSKAHLAIIHGYMDHAGRYRAPSQAWTRAGLAVHSFDYRGHGQSDGRRAHVDRFDDYLDDVARFLNRVKEAAKGKPLFVLAHSNGGLIAVRYISQHPEGISGLILSAPYLKIATPPALVKRLAAPILNRLIPWLPVPSGLTSADLTRDEEFQRATDRDHLYIRSATPGWFAQSTLAQALALKDGPKLTLPTYVFLGEKDPVASTPATRAFFETLGSADKKYKEYPGMLHECLNEVGKEQVWQDVIVWISSKL